MIRFGVFFFFLDFFSPTKPPFCFSLFPSVFSVIVVLPFYFPFFPFFAAAGE